MLSGPVAATPPTSPQLRWPRSSAPTSPSPTSSANVLKLYHEEKAKYEAAGDMTRKKVMDMLLESYDMAKLMAEPASMVSAAREIGKMCGYYAPVESRVKVDVSGNVMLDRLNNLSDAELLKLISDGSAS